MSWNRHAPCSLAKQHVATLSKSQKLPLCLQEKPFQILEIIAHLIAFRDSTRISNNQAIYDNLKTL